MTPHVLPQSYRKMRTLILKRVRSKASTQPTRATGTCSTSSTAPSAA